MKDFCSSKENCLRSTMIRAVGGSVQQQQQQQSLCCVVCNPTAFLDGRRLDITQPGRPAPRKRRRVVRRVVDESGIKLQLQAERKKFMEENPSLAIVGEQMVCPDGVIREICSSAKYISVVKDMDLFFLRTELKERFFNVIISYVVN